MAHIITYRECLTGTLFSNLLVPFLSPLLGGLTISPVTPHHNLRQGSSCCPILSHRIPIYGDLLEVDDSAIEPMENKECCLLASLLATDAAWLNCSAPAFDKGTHWSNKLAGCLP